jgi:hypothetical protein
MSVVKEGTKQKMDANREDLPSPSLQVGNGDLGELALGILARELKGRGRKRENFQ